MRAAQVSRLRRLPRDTTLDQRIQDRHKPAEHDLQPPEVEGQGAPVPERPERGLQALPVAGEPRDLEQIPAEMAGVPFELVLHPLGADTLAPPDLEPRAGDRRVHRRLVHALRRVPELLDHQGAVAGLEPVGGEHRIQDHASASAFAYLPSRQPASRTSWPAPRPSQPGASRSMSGERGSRLRCSSSLPSAGQPWPAYRSAMAWREAGSVMPQRLAERRVRVERVSPRGGIKGSMGPS